MNGFTTKVLHTRYKKKDAHGSLKMPIYENVAFECESASEISQAFKGETQFHTYSRVSNPTVEYLENQVQNLTNSYAVLAVSSGMAAISNCIMTIGSSNCNIVASKYLFGNSYSLLSSTLKRWGLEVRFVDITDAVEIKSKIDNNTIAIFTETISNPQMVVADFDMLSKITKEYNLVLIADTTLSSLYLFDAHRFGVDIEIFSSTKFVSGGGTSVGGFIIDHGTFDWSKLDALCNSNNKIDGSLFIKKLRKDVYRNFGGCMSPHAAYLQSLGLETLALRIDKTCDNTLKMAEYLSKHEKVKSVEYPGLRTHHQHELSIKQFPKGSGGLLHFNLESQEACYTLIDRLQLIRRATNLNANQSLIIHPASTIYCEYKKEQLEDLGINDTMIRLAVGIEDFEDIKADLDQAFKSV